MADRRYRRTALYRDQLGTADVKGLHADVQAFATIFIRRMGRLGIPVHVGAGYVSRATQHRLYVTGADPEPETVHSARRTVAIVHSTLGGNLPGRCWEVFQHVANEAAATLCRRAVWGGPNAPCLFTLMAV